MKEPLNRFTLPQPTAGLAPKEDPQEEVRAFYAWCEQQAAEAA
jgi:hypothetical protein